MPIKAGVSMQEYLALDAVNHSTLKLFSKTPAHARQEMLHPSPPTEAQDLGTAIHTAILEPGRFKHDYVVAPKVDRRTKEGKAAWVAFEQEHPHSEILKEGDHAVCLGIQAAVWANPLLKMLLSGKGANEVVVTWDDPEFNVPCKARLDRITTHAGFTLLLDFKSTTDASPWAFGRSVAKYGYHSQAAMYLDGCAAVQPGERRFISIPIEKEEPYAIGIYEVKPQGIDQGRIDYRKWLAQYVEAKQNGLWPGYPAEIVPLDLPAYAFKNEDFE